MGPARLMVVLIVNTGRVEQRVIETSHDLSTKDGEATLGLVRAKVNALTVGQRLGDAAASLAALADEFAPTDRDLVRAIVQSLDDALVEEREERVVLAGTANLARVGTDFPLSIGPVLEALEQHVVLLKLLGTAREASDLVSVRIGHENPFAGLQSTSVVSTEYGAGPSCWLVSACSDRPGWTTPRRWRRCGQWPPTSPESSRSEDPPGASTPVMHHRPAPSTHR